MTAYSELVTIQHATLRFAVTYVWGPPKALSNVAGFIKL